MSALEALLDSQESEGNPEEENDQDAFNDAFLEEAVPQDDGLGGEAGPDDVGSGDGGVGDGDLGDGDLGDGGVGDGDLDGGGFSDRDEPAEVQYIQVLTVQVKCYLIEPNINGSSLIKISKLTVTSFQHRYP